MKADTLVLKTAYRILLIVGYVLYGSPFAYAAPIVIFDSGQTQSLVPYFKTINTQAAIQAQMQQQSSLAALPTEGSASERLQMLAQALPVRTPEMTPGAVRPQILKMPYLERPVFVIGADPLSAQWLQQHRPRLNTLHAVGLVVNVDTAEQLAELKQLGNPLELYALPGTSFAKQFGLAHYPALISASRIEQ